MDKNKLSAKAVTTIKQASNKAAENPKWVLGGLLLLGGLFAGKKIYDYFLGKSEAEKAREQFDKQLTELPYNPQGLSISDTDARLIVANIFNEMNGYFTDGEYVVSQLRGLNRNDLLLVINLFGIRDYNGAGEASNWIDRNFLSTPKNLIGWLQSELDNSEKEEAKQIFTSQGIPF